MLVTWYPEYFLAKKSKQSWAVVAFGGKLSYTLIDEPDEILSMDCHISQGSPKAFKYSSCFMLTGNTIDTVKSCQSDEGVLIL